MWARWIFDSTQAQKVQMGDKINMKIYYLGGFNIYGGMLKV